MTLEGSCRCGAVHFTVQTHAPHPYQLCYCSICRKTAGGGGYAINLSAAANTLKVRGKKAIGVYRAEIEEGGGKCYTSSGQRNFCTRCASALWLYDPTWPELLHPFASAIETELPVPPSRTHIMLRFKPSWVQPDIRPGDVCKDEYPDESIEEWHRSRGLWLQ